MFLSFAGLSATQFHGYLFEGKGFSPLQIGLLLGAGYAAGLLAPPAQVWAIRRLRGPRLPLIHALAGAGLGIALLPWAGGFGGVLFLFFCALFCSAGIHPLTAACALEATRTKGQGVYFLIRSLGTAGFLAGCIGSYFQPGTDKLAWLYLAFGLAFWVTIPLALNRFRPADPRQAPEDILVTPHPRRTPGFRRALRLLSAPRPKRLLWTLGVMNFANAMATLVQGNYLVARFGGGQKSISLAWIVATAWEIPLMILCAWLVRRYGLRTVIGFGLLGTTIKLLLLGIADSYGMYLAGLAFHGCFFSGALVGFNLFVDKHFDIADRPPLQSLGALFYTGLPTAVGGLTAGILWHYHGLRSVYLVAAVIGVGTGLYTLRLLRSLPAASAGGTRYPVPGNRKGQGEILPP
jgi:PPP family 3-phenylpropionic acid transporter